MGSRQHPHIDLDRLVAAHPLDLRLLQEAQQVGLKIQRQVADLVEEQGTAMGRLDPTDLALVGTSEGPLLVTEQFGLDQLLGNRTTVDRHEGLLGATRQAVQGVGHQLLAGPALAADQYRRIGRSELAEQLAQLAHAQ
ncbi:hypothetical protein D3C75_963480 [compost metagenome]